MTSEQIALQMLYEACEDIALAATVALDNETAEIRTSQAKIKALLRAVNVANAVGVRYGEMRPADSEVARKLLGESA